MIQVAFQVDVYRSSWHCDHMWLTLSGVGETPCVMNCVPSHLLSSLYLFFQGNIHTHLVNMVHVGKDAVVVPIRSHQLTWTIVVTKPGTKSGCVTNKEVNSNSSWHHTLHQTWIHTSPACGQFPDRQKMKLPGTCACPEPSSLIQSCQTLTFHATGWRCTSLVARSCVYFVCGSECEDDCSGRRKPMKLSVALVTKRNQCNWHVGMAGLAVVSSDRLPGISNVNLPVEMICCVTFICFSNVDINPRSKIIGMHKGIICQERHYNCLNFKHWEFFLHQRESPNRTLASWWLL